LEIILQFFRYILFPFGVIYAIVTEIRNFLFDKAILKSEKFDIPIINVGNLSVGGTGKTPQIEYLIKLLKNDYKIAVLSRGYKRSTSGFIVADKNSSAEQIGDEPYQIFRKFNDIIVCVGEKRVPAIQQIIKNFNPDVILLDDAFQHRTVKAGLNIVLTPFSLPFSKDFILPVGDLRECRHHIRRADLLIVSKTPENIEEEQKNKIKQSIGKYYKKDVFFSSIKYADKVINERNEIKINDLSNYKLLIVTGIAKPDVIFTFFSKKSINFESLKFGDHHNFSDKDINLITKKFGEIGAENKLIVTTEKDYVRWNNKHNLPVYYLPIETKIENKALFNQKIIDYVRK